MPRRKASFQRYTSVEHYRSAEVNLRHLKTVLGGARSIIAWRRKNPKKVFQLSGVALVDTDLSGIDLSSADLSFADLRFSDFFRASLCGAQLYDAIMLGADLSYAKLSNADLRKSNLSEARLDHTELSQSNSGQSDFSDTILAKANFHRADVSEADFSFAKMQDANFSEALLAHAVFYEAELHKVDLSGSNLLATIFLFTELDEVDFAKAAMDNTIISNCDLSRCSGLDTVEHRGRSSIDINTLITTFRNSGNSLDENLKAFFINSGMPKELLDALPKIVAEVKYFTCFVSYGNPDRKFAERIVGGLRSSGVSCWLYSLDATPGEKVWKEIKKKMREADRMIVLCSARSLIRDGVLKEIEEQIDENPNKLVPISLDKIWNAEGFAIKRGNNNLKPFLVEKTYADFSSGEKYGESIDKLLNALKQHQKVHR